LAIYHLPFAFHAHTISITSFTISILLFLHHTFF
jgi:hypothetical protein